MINKCPKCKGTIHTREVFQATESRCLNCGYEVFNVPKDVLTEVERFQGKKQFTKTRPSQNYTT